jgi:hypothetical protein
MNGINLKTVAVVAFVGIVTAAARAQSAGPLIPPYQTPAYTRPADDSVVFGSLLEASGYSPAANAAWVGVAAGSFCGGSEKELILAQNQAPNFSVMHGPAPYVRTSEGTASLGSSSAHPWRAVSAGNLDGSSQDELIAVRKVTASGIPDLVVAKVGTCSCSMLAKNTGLCESPAIIASAAIGNQNNSDWVGAAIGNFDGTGKKIALLKTAHSNLFLVKLTEPGNSLSVVYSGDLTPDGSQSSQWKALAAGDIDGDGLDELIAARQVSDGQSPTVIAYKWDVNRREFYPLASSGFGNDGNSNWASAAAGDFNADGRQAVVLVKDRHSNFAVMDFPAGASQLRTLATDDLDSVDGQTWTGLAATDWLSGDQGASELVAVRAVHGANRTNVFVYGNPFHRVSRDTAMEASKAQWNQYLSGSDSPSAVADVKNWIAASHTNTFLWLVGHTGDYTGLVQFLHDTKNWGVDGKQLRVWLTLVAPYQLTDPTVCSQPEPTPGLTTWSALDFFTGDTKASAYATELAQCHDVLAWASVAGRLAQDFPQLVGLVFDDFTNHVDEVFTPDTIAGMESNMRTQAPWMNFSPIVYYPNGPAWTSNWSDLGLTLDSMIFFFRNQKASVCIGTAACDSTVNNAPGEIADMSKLLPTGRKMLLGIYYQPLYGEPMQYRGLQPTISYDYNLTRIALTQPAAGSAVAYGLQGYPSVTCTDGNVLLDLSCALQRAYGNEGPLLLLGIAPSTITFPQTALNGSNTSALVITNPGFDDVTVTLPPSPPPGSATFYWTGGTFVVSPGKPLTVNVTFVPKAQGGVQQTLVITSNAVGSPFNIILSGTGRATVPNLLYLPQSSATGAITSLGLVPSVSFSKACTNPGDVLTQSPLPGTLVAPGSTVNITVDSGTLKSCVLK